MSHWHDWILVAAILGAAVLAWPLARWLIRDLAGQDWSRKKNAHIMVLLFYMGGLLVWIGVYGALVDGDFVGLLVGGAIGSALVSAAAWTTRRAQLAGESSFSDVEVGFTYLISRGWHWIAIATGVLLLFGSQELDERLWGLGVTSTGVLLLGFRLYRHPSPAPMLAGPYTRPVGQMILATLANLGLAVALSACGVAAGMLINARDPTRAQLDTPTLVAGVALFVVQAFVVPLHAWWRWFEQRDTRQLVRKIAEELDRLDER
jgi:hypothetical protein